MSHFCTACTNVLMKLNFNSVFIICPGLIIVPFEKLAHCIFGSLHLGIGLFLL